MILGFMGEDRGCRGVLVVFVNWFFCGIWSFKDDEVFVFFLLESFVEN